MRLFALLFVAAVLLGTAHLSIDAAQPQTAPQAAEALPIHLDLDCKGMPLGEVVQALRDQSQENIFVNWQTLKPTNVNESLPITLDLTGITTLDQAVAKLLEHINGKHVNLSHELIDDVYVISTSKDLIRGRHLQFYDIRNAYDNKTDAAVTTEQIIRRVCGLDPLSWRSANPESDNNIRELNRNLIVTCSPEMHRLIQQELADILQ
ncbi:MAG: hypothetical protein AAGA25_07905 [Planctomycetota bacterium]